MKKMTKIYKYIFWSFIFLLLFIIQFSHFRLDSDSGIFLTGAWNLANNLEIYKDFFSFTAPGAYYLILLVWKIFGISYWFAWALGFLFLSVSVFLVYKIASFISKPSAYLAALLFVISTIGWPIISSHVFVLPFILGAIYFVVIGMERKKLILLYLSAILAGMSVLFLQTVGLATIVGIFIFLIINYRQNIYLAPRVIVFVLILNILPTLALFLKWTPLYLFDNLVKFPIFNYSSVIFIDYWQLIFNLLFLTFLFLILRKRSKQIATINLLYIAGVCLFLTVIPFPDYSHIRFVYSPMLILFSILTVDFFKNGLKDYSHLKIALIISFFNYFLFHLLVSLFFSGFLFLTLKNQSVPLVDYVNNNCKSKYIYAGPFIPEMYFETRRLSSGPTDWLLTGSDKYYELTLNGIQKNKPDCVILEYEIIKKFRYDNNNIVDSFIRNNYKEVALFGKVHVLKIVD